MSQITIVTGKKCSSFVFLLFVFVVLEFELKTYTSSHSTSPFL
jgi:hypothetical protein